MQSKKPAPGKPVQAFLLFQNFGITLAILNTPGDPAQSGRGDIGLGNDLVVGFALHQKLGGVDPLGHLLHFLVGA